MKPVRKSFAEAGLARLHMNMVCDTGSSHYQPKGVRFAADFPHKKTVEKRRVPRLGRAPPEPRKVGGETFRSATPDESGSCYESVIDDRSGLAAAALAAVSVPVAAIPIGPRKCRTTQQKLHCDERGWNAYVPDCNSHFIACGTPGSEPPHQQQNDHDQKNDSDAATRVVAPRSAMRPPRNASKQRYEQNHDQKYSEHVGSSSNRPNRSFIAAEALTYRTLNSYNPASRSLSAGRRPDCLGGCGATASNRSVRAGSICENPDNLRGVR